MNESVVVVPVGRGDQSERLAPRLTHRETEVLRLRALGWSNKEVAHELGIAVKTVYIHRVNMAAKLGSGLLVDMLRAVGWLRVPE